MISLQIFQRIWSGHVTCEEKAFELLSLLDQIHMWAITEHRSFILDHLRAWHKNCDKNLLLEWDSRFDLGDDKKRRRALNEAGELNLPKWVSYFSEPNQRNIQSRARRCLKQVLAEEHQLKKKFDGDSITLACEADDCSHQMVPSLPVIVHHYRAVHHMSERELAEIRAWFRRGRTDYNIQKRLEEGITLSGKRSFLLRASLGWQSHLGPGPSKPANSLDREEV
jgi:hypothetical protein